MATGEEWSFGQRLRRERESQHWTQEQLAEKIGSSVPSINRWEHDRATPRQDMFNLLSEVFGKPPERWGTGRQILWNIPFLRNPYFTGRDQLLLRLHQALAADNTVALSQTRAISGLGGIGKTQTAIEYAYRYANEYEAVLWVQADSREVLVADFARLALTLNVLEKEEADSFRMITAVKRWLEKHGPWLLILDNADDLAVVSDFLPRWPGGAMLLTTHSQITGPHIKNIPMEKMSREEGITFLLRRIASEGDEDGEGDLFKNVSAREQHAASELWEMMGGLPLALDQAGAYIKAGQISIAEYVDLYRNHSNVLLQERGGVVPEHPEAVATTWSLSFQRVEEQNPAAAELLRLCAFLSPDTISEEIITGGAAYFNTPLQGLATSKLLMNKAIMTLSAYSLVRRDARAQALSIHRLVQIVLINDMSVSSRKQWQERVVRVLNAAFPSAPFKDWLRCGRLLPHVLVCANWIEDEPMPTLVEASSLFDKVGSYLREQGEYAEAEPLLVRALSIREQHLGAEHLDTATSLSNLAGLYSYQGKYKQAELLVLQALSIREQYLGAEHPETARSLGNLALLYMQQGKYEQAEPLYQRSLSIHEQHSGSQSPEIAYPLYGLAELYRHQQKYEEAEPLYQRVLSIRQQYLDEDHLDTAESLQGLADLYREQRKYDQARPLYEQALRILQQQLGPEHSLTQQTQKNYATLLQIMGGTQAQET